MGEENLEFGLSNTMISIATSTGVQNWLKFILTLVTAIQMSTQLAHNYDPKENMDDLFSICIKNLWLIFWFGLYVCGFYVLHTFNSLKKGDIRKLDMGEEYELEGDSIKKMYEEFDDRDRSYLGRDEIWTVLLLRFALTSWTICFIILLHDTISDSEEFRKHMQDAEVINNYVIYLLLAPTHFLCWAPAWIVLSNTIRSHCIFLKNALEQAPADVKSWARVRRVSMENIEWENSGICPDSKMPDATPSNQEYVWNQDICDVIEEDDVSIDQCSDLLSPKYVLSQQSQTHSLSLYSEHSDQDIPCGVEHAGAVQRESVQRTVMIREMNDFSHFFQRWYILHAIIMKFNKLMTPYISMIVVMMVFAWILGFLQLVLVIFNVGWYKDKDQYVYSATNIGLWASFALMITVFKLQLINGTQRNATKELKREVTKQAKKHRQYWSNIMHGYDIAIEFLTEKYPIVVQVGPVSVKGMQFRIAKIVTSAAMLGWVVRMLYSLNRHGALTFIS